MPTTERTDRAAGGPASLRVPEGSPQSRSAAAFELSHDGDTELIACIGPILVLVVEAVTPAGVAVLGTTMPALLERYPKIGSLTVVERRLGPSIDADGRKAVAELSSRYTSDIVGSAVVCEGTGFRATAIRSIVTAVRMASRASHPQKVFASADEAVSWLAALQPNLAINPASAVQTIAMLRARLQERVTRSGVPSTR